MDDNRKFKNIIYAVLKKYKEFMSGGSMEPKEALDSAIDEISKIIDHQGKCGDKQNRYAEFIFGLGTGISTSLLYDIGKSITLNAVETKTFDRRFPPSGSAPK